MSLTDRREDLLIAVALTEFSVHYEQADPELAEHVLQLAADRLVGHDVEPAEAVDALEIDIVTTETIYTLIATQSPIRCAVTFSDYYSYRSAFDRCEKPQNAARIGTGDGRLAA